MIAAKEEIERLPRLQTDPSLYSGESHEFRKPEIVGHFTLNNGHDFSCDLSGLRYIRTPRNPNHVHFDLNYGWKRAIRKDNEDYNDKFLYLPKWLMNEEGGKGQPWKEADFITNRGLLKTLMCTLYEKKEGWIICAMQVHGVIFLYPKETEKRKASRIHETNYQRKQTSWGFKFEQYMTSDKPYKNPNTRVPVNEGDSFMGVFKAKLNNHTLIYQAEIDGIENQHEVVDLKKAKMVELKTSNFKLNKSLTGSKGLRWWAQSHLNGTTKIICGIRDEKGIVFQLRPLSVERLPQLGNVSFALHDIEQVAQERIHGDHKA